MSSDAYWDTIRDADVRHIWCDPDGNDETAIEPSFYAESGTPCCGDGDHEGDDMTYVRTEIRKPLINVVLKAAKFSAAAHEFQFRKMTKAPYITHPSRVAARISYLHSADENWVAAAWCHDVLEDCNVTIEQLTEHIGEKAAEIVRELTNPSKDFKDLPRAERKKMDREHLSTCSFAARCIKLVDRADNLAEMDLYDNSFKSLYADESEALLQSILKSAVINNDDVVDIVSLGFALSTAITNLRSTIEKNS